MYTYLFQTISFQVIFLIVYELFLKKETFFTYNRIYLLVTPILALLLPLLKIPLLQTVIPPETYTMLPEVLIGGNSQELHAVHLNSLSSETAQVINSWLFIYVGGLLFSLGFFFNKLRILKQLFSHKPLVKNAEVKIVEVPHSRIACTFYNTIFMGADLVEKEREQILSHELVHVKQKHTLDLLLFEILRLLFWFNPVIYIFQARISAVHEYLADAGVVKNVKKQDYFQQLLNSAFNTENISFINQFFNQSIIKKRIVMIQKAKSTSTSKFKFLIILPLMLGMLTYVSCSQDPVVSQEDQEIGAQEKLNEIKAIINESSEMTSEDKKKIEAVLNTNSIKELKKSVKSRETIEIKNSKNAISGAGDIPFAVIEEVPVFPGCQSLESNEQRKKCTSEKVTEFVSENYDASLGKEYGLEGINRIYVQFRINAEGTVEVLGARAPHPALQKEAERVINLMPQMIPGKQKGKEIAVLYTLPITVKVGE